MKYKLRRYQDPDCPCNYIYKLVEDLDGYDLIQIKRGLYESIQDLKLKPGEPAFIFDTQELYVGGADGQPICVNPSKLEFSTLAEFPETGLPNALYVATDTDEIYRYNVTAGSYKRVGTDYKEVTILDGGNSDWTLNPQSWVNVDDVAFRVHITLRRDLRQNWIEKNPVLNDGELGLEYIPQSGTNSYLIQAKVGNGVLPWTDLPYLGSGTVTLPAPDGTTIVDDQGIWSIQGFANAPNGAYPVKRQSTGAFEWIPLPYTKEEVDNIVSELYSGLDWREAVDTFDDIAITYPNPEDGWTVNVRDTNYTYRYNGHEWIPISANAIPVATAPDETSPGVNGLMTPAQVLKLASIANNAQVNLLESVATPDGALVITDKRVTIPVAGSTFGLVTSSANGNQVSVDPYTGQMSVNSVSTDLLRSGTDVLILSSGIDE